MEIDEKEDERNIEAIRRSVMEDERTWRVSGSFSLLVEGSTPAEATALKYSTCSMHTQANIEKIIRAMQLDKSILLEGMPGVGKHSPPPPHAVLRASILSAGKSSVIEYIAAMTQNTLTRISLSE